MHRKLTITLTDNVYEGLHRVVGRGNISQFIEALVRPHVLPDDLEEGYRQMAMDEAQEKDAAEWLKGIGTEFIVE